jgi:hypothetical protein
MDNKSRCIMCGEARDGLEVKDDWVISGVRWFKKNVTKSSKGLRLVVCRPDYEKYEKERKRYVRNRALYVGLGVLFAVMLALVGGLRAIPMGLLFIVILYLVSLFSYMPDVLKPEKEPAKEKTQRRRK